MGNGMGKTVLLNCSFVSDVLLNYLRENQIPVFAQGELKEKLLHQNISVLGEECIKQRLASGECIPYSNATECFVPLIMDACPNAGFAKAIKLFNNKALFRETLRELSPNFYFKEISAQDAASFTPPEGKELILKPKVGFWSIGIRKFSGKEGFQKALAEALAEIEEYKKRPNSPKIDSVNFLVEEVAKGEEFACDAYFDKEGKPVVLGIYAHPFRDEEDTRDLVYITGKKIMQRMLPHAQTFLLSLSQKIDLSNFPMHFEFILTKENNLIPIEVNPLRFGGYGLADLPLLAFGINPYECYFNVKKPDWESMLRNSSSDYFGFVLGRMEGIKFPDVQKFKKTFHKPCKFIPTDCKASPVFCIAYPQSADLNEMTKYLHFDFGEYEAEGIE